MICAVTIKARLPKGREGSTELILSKDQGAAIAISRDGDDSYRISIDNQNNTQIAKVKLSQKEVEQLHGVLALLLTAPYG